MHNTFLWLASRQYRGFYRKQHNERIHMALQLEQVISSLKVSIDNLTTSIDRAVAFTGVPAEIVVAETARIDAQTARLNQRFPDAGAAPVDPPANP